jgi:hypothetical protein
MALCSYATLADAVTGQEIAPAFLSEARALERPDWPPHLLVFGAVAEGAVWQSDPDKWLSSRRRARPGAR